MERVVSGDPYPVAKVRRDLYDALHPAGMHTNGPIRVPVEASNLQWLIAHYERTKNAS